MTEPAENSITVAALYKFASLPDTASLRPALLAACEQNGVMGTLILAGEGINGTIAGSARGIDRVLAHIRALPGCADLDWKRSFAPAMPFKRMKVRLKREIVTMGVPGLDPVLAAGTYVEPKDWNGLITAPDVIVIDTRNDYEVAIGSFAAARDPNTKSFGQFPDWAAEHLPAENLAGDNRQRIAMFCTGGIRCEKATALLKQRGFAEVYHLKGGILKYLEEVPEADSLWQGECFVFDERVSVGHNLKPGPYQLCSSCREPMLTGAAGGGYATELCSTCQSTADDTRRQAAAERMRQIEIARARGTTHIGAKARVGMRAGQKSAGDATQPARSKRIERGN